MIKFNILKSIQQFFFIGLITCLPYFAFAIDNSIDKIYHPYVNALEMEFEYRLIAQEDNNDKLDNQFKHRLGFSYTPTDRFNIEFYLIGEDVKDQSFKISTYEIETIIQLTEQGEY